MTSSIDDSQDLRISPAPEQQPADSNTIPLIRGVQIFTGVTTGAGVGLLTAGFILDEWRLGVLGFTFLSFAAASAAVWTLNALLADRGEFYRRGLLDGWMRGWRGQEPETDDPLLRR